MVPATWLWEALAWLSLPLLVVIATLLVWRRTYRDFPFFFIYVLTAILVGVIRFVVYKTLSPTAYFYIYWWSGFIGLVSTLLALYETFLRRIFPRSSGVRIYRYVFPAAAAVTAFLAFVIAMNSPDKRAVVYVISRISDFVRSAVIGFFVLLILLMGREFSGYEFGITAGFGVQAIVALANWAIKSLGNSPRGLDRYEPLAYDAACVIWLWSFSKPKKPPVTPTQNIDVQTLHQARKWESSLKDWLTPGKK